MTTLQSTATTVQDRLAETRRLAGFSRRSIAPLIGVTYTTVSRWETGVSEPSITQFMLWAAATKQPVEAMLDGLSWCTPWDSNPEPTDYSLRGAESVYDLRFWDIVSTLAVTA